MKNIVFILLILFLAGCSFPSEHDKQPEAVEAAETVNNEKTGEEYFVAGNERFKTSSEMLKVHIVVDQETGCKYIYSNTRNTGGLSPLYDNDGNVDCGN